MLLLYVTLHSQIKAFDVRILSVNGDIMIAKYDIVMLGFKATIYLLLL